MFHLHKQSHETTISTLNTFMYSNNEEEDIIDSTSLNVLSAITNFMLTYSSLWLDTYSLMRMFKTPTNGTQPTLLLGFFGHTHAINMCTRLLHMGYQIASSTDVSFTASRQASRCITFTSFIDLERDVKRHTMMRFRNETNQRQQIYQQKLIEEKEKRKTTKTLNATRNTAGGALRTHRKQRKLRTLRTRRTLRNLRR